MGARRPPRRLVATRDIRDAAGRLIFRAGDPVPAHDARRYGLAVPADVREVQFDPTTEVK